MLAVAFVLGAASARGSIAAAPANDNFANATVLSGTSDSETGTNVDATLEAGEPTTITADGATIPAHHSVWYRWTAPASDLVRIDLDGSGYDTLLAVYTGSAVNALGPTIASNDDDFDITSVVTFAATSGTTYQIRVDGNDTLGNGMGAISLHLHQGRPANDDFANATPLNGSNVSHDDTNALATLEAGEAPKVAGSNGGASVWYSWAPPVNGSVTIDTATSNFDTLLGAYTGADVAALNEVASNDDVNPSTNKTSSVTFPVTFGTTYKIRVDGFEGSVGTIHLHVTLRTVPAAPTGVTSSPGDSQVTLNWSAPVSDGGSAITGYDVTRYTNGNPQGVTSVGAATQATIGGLTNGTTYTFKVAAKNAVGTGPQSAESAAVTPRTVPGAPTNVSAAAAPGQATVTWSAPASNGGSAITGYDVTRYVGGVPQAVTPVGPVTQVTISGLTNGMTYTFKVAAKNAAGTGPASADSNAVTPALPRFTLTVTKSGTGSGTIASSPAGISCGTACTSAFDSGATVTLTATPAAQSTFAGWSGACTGSGQCTVTLDAVKSVGATFNQILVPPTKTVVYCVVPNVKGKPLATAKRRIAAGHCAIGKITKAKSKTVAKGRVISQKPRAGTKLRAGSKVNLVLSRGKR